MNDRRYLGEWDVPPHRGVRYALLTAYLAAMPPEQTTVVLTFTAIEALIGASLPVSAFSSSYWRWGKPARHHWRHAGWSGHLDRGQHAVTFTRDAQQP